MRLILSEDVPNLGEAGDVVRVRPGYGRNYLIPQGKATLATEGRVTQLEHQKQVIEEKVKKEIGGHRKLADRLGNALLKFERQSGDEGKLFGSVTNADIREQLGEQGFEVERRRIELADPIKQIGEYEVPIRLHREVQAQIRVSVVSAGGAPEKSAEGSAADPAEGDPAESAMEEETPRSDEERFAEDASDE